MNILKTMEKQIYRQEDVFQLTNLKAGNMAWFLTLPRDCVVPDVNIRKLCGKRVGEKTFEFLRSAFLSASSADFVAYFLMCFVAVSFFFFKAI
jgi:hypothetical protein